MFRRMIETTTKCAWWTILFELGSTIMHIMLMVLVIVMALVIASSATAWSVIVSTTAMATSTSITAIIIIIMAAAGGIKLFTVALASIIILLSPFPLLRTSIWFSTAVLTPVGSTASIVTSIILVMVIIVYIFILFFLFRGRGRWLRLLL